MKAFYREAAEAMHRVTLMGVYERKMSGRPKLEVLAMLNAMNESDTGDWKRIYNTFAEDL